MSSTPTCWRPSYAGCPTRRSPPSSPVSARDDLTEEEGIAYDLAASLISGGVLPALTYQRAVGAFGLEGAAEFIYLVGLYCAVSVTLNGFDVPLPEDAA